VSQKRFIAKNGLDNNNQTVTNVSDPVNLQDAATKNITDSIDLKAGSAYSQANSAYAKANSVVLTITGTANQIVANSSTGNVLLSLPSSINVNSNSASSINLTENNSFSGNTYISWSFNSSSNNTLQTTANLTFTPSSGVLRSTGFAAKGGLLEHANVISVDYAITDGYNAISAGPITIANNITVSIPSGSTWTIV
jgi:hypothetical protein